MNRTGRLRFSLCVALITLLSITSSSTWAVDATLHEKLPDTLKGVEIQNDYVPASGFTRAGLVHALQGTVVVMHRADETAFVASKGTPIHENDELFTLSDSRCRIRFRTDDVVNMAPNAHFSVDKFLDSPGRGEKTSLFSLFRGKAVFYALRLFRYKKTRFHVKTPTAVVGVRGTCFGVNVFELEAERAQQNGVRIADSGIGMGAYLAQAGSESRPKTGTIVACGDGQLDVTDPTTGRRIARMNPNEDFNSVTGQKTFDPRNRTLNQIAAEAEVQETDGEEGASVRKEETEMEDAEGTEGDVLDPLGDSEGESAETGADVVEGIIDTTSIEVQEEVTEVREDGISQGKTSGRAFGYSFFITDNTYGKAWYFSGPPRKGPKYKSDQVGKDGLYYRTGGPEALSGFEEFNGNDSGPNYQVILQEQNAPLTEATVNQFDWGTGGDISLPSPHIFQYIKADSYKDESGHEYLEWGYWQDTSGSEIGKIAYDGVNGYFAASGKIWHVEGDITHTDYIDYLQSQGAQYTYTGEAKGVYVNSAVADVHELSGSFSCDVDFGSRQVSDFSIGVSGGGHNVYIHNGSGMIESVEGGSGFNIESFSGNIDGAALNTSVDAAGATFAGDKAQGILGMWRAWDGADQWAGGEFHGKR